MRTVKLSNAKRPLFGADNNNLTLIIAVNALIFIILFFTRMTYQLAYDKQADAFFERQIVNWFALPSNVSTWLTRPWTLITYAVSQLSFLALLSNMLWLWAFGFIVQDLIGDKKIIPLYLYGTVISAITFLLIASNTSNAGNYVMLGATAPALTIAIAATTILPEYRIFPQLNGGIPLWILTIVFVGLDFASVASQTPYFLSHMMAALFGFLFIKQLKKGRDWSAWMMNLTNKIDDWFNPSKKVNKSSTTFYTSSTPTFQKTVNLTQQKLDEILDKISTNGFESLSAEEKDFLEKASKEL